jgi:hypothetical protein
LRLHAEVLTNRPFCLSKEQKQCNARKDTSICKGENRPPLASLRMGPVIGETSENHGYLTMCCVAIFVCVVIFSVCYSDRLLASLIDSLI